MCFLYIRVICQLNWSFGRELVVLRTILSMFGKFSVHAWSQCGSLALNEAL